MEGRFYALSKKSLPIFEEVASIFVLRSEDCLKNEAVFYFLGSKNEEHSSRLPRLLLRILFSSNQVSLDSRRAYVPSDRSSGPKIGPKIVIGLHSRRGRAERGRTGCRRDDSPRKQPTLLLPRHRIYLSGTILWKHEQPEPYVN